ncbi:MAG: NUDIX hydrolase [Candidatus Daviesbacteria bacterium]|nr:NUDIX hydrolase [Candidatus Daviesbacteria bacterium]
MNFKAALCVVKTENGILFCKREDNGLWVIPGGGIEKDEKPEKAAIRELEEETGIIAKNVKFKGIWNFDLLGKKSRHAVFEALGEIKGELRPSWETPKVKFFSDEEINKKMPKYIQTLLKQLEKEDFFEIDASGFEWWVAGRFIFGKLKKKIRSLLVRGF